MAGSKRQVSPAGESGRNGVERGAFINASQAEGNPPRIASTEVAAGSQPVVTVGKRGALITEIPHAKSTNKFSLSVANMQKMR